MADGVVTSCRHCGHDVAAHGDRAIIRCATAVRSALSPFRAVQCPCPGFRQGLAESIPLPPLREPDPPPIATDPVGVSWYEYLREVVWRGRLGG